ncbi:zinc-binding dehydrogenase [Paracoccus sp. (in: a-proteobacteria)]|uniref:zinc-binding dehydrogenase n=1 Tax=Paracoccus sp. TaxID=267 RepID=UPI002AFEA21E|nr:zinc-binding dehydrogenase [Paracoccus sp. (in: a-proteobacteria)]
MRMTAAVMFEQALPVPYAKSRPFRIEEVDLEGPGEGEVLVEIVAAGLCHSDLSTVAGTNKRALPLVGGHEGAGIVREIGRGVTELKPGDHVVMTVAAGCGQCRYCRDGRALLCDAVAATRVAGQLTNGQRRLSMGGKPVYHYAGLSSFAQYAVTVPSALVRIDPEVPLDVAALFGCAVVTGAGAVFNAAKVRPGQTVAVFGLGGVGLNAVMAARIAGATEIIGVDLNEDKFGLATELGCTCCVSPKDPDFAEKVRDLTEGGVSFSFEVSGAKPAMAAANDITRKGGEIVCVGLGNFGEKYEYFHAQLVTGEKVFRGCFMGSGVAQRDIPLYVDFFKRGKLRVDRLKSSGIGFGQLNDSLDRLDRGEVVRQVLMPHA